jgi:hypothetical protein
MMQMSLVSQTVAGEEKRKFSNLMLSNSFIAAPNDGLVYKEWNIKTQEVVVATYYTAEKKILGCSL